MVLSRPAPEFSPFSLAEGTGAGRIPLELPRPLRLPPALLLPALVEPPLGAG